MKTCEVKSMPFDLLVKGREVIDPGSDAAVHLTCGPSNRIAAVDQISGERRCQGDRRHRKIVTQGSWICTATSSTAAATGGLRPDPVASRSGVTTWIDAGSAAP